MSTRTFARLAASAALAVAVLGHGLVPGAVGADPVPAEPPSDATVLGARWLAGQLTPDGYVEGLFAPGPDSDATRDVAFTLAATGLEDEAFDSALAWLTANVEAVIDPEGEPEEAGSMA